METNMHKAQVDIHTAPSRERTVLHKILRSLRGATRERVVLRLE